MVRSKRGGYLHHEVGTRRKVCRAGDHEPLPKVPGPGGIHGDKYPGISTW
jgi:hypothetical protein